MHIINTMNELIDNLEGERSKNNYISLIPTMGNLHDGHISLIKNAKKYKSKNFVTIYVNPLQFNDKQDLESYPRTLDRDLEKLIDEDVDYVFIPDNLEISDMIIKDINLPWGFENFLCGKTRQNHFYGVYKIVEYFLRIFKPKFVFFGEKDYQQYLLVMYIIKSHFLKNNIDLILCPTIRTTDGLAISSRNSRLSNSEKTLAAKMMTSFFKTVKDYFNSTGLYNIDNLIPKNKDIVFEYAKVVNEKTLLEKHGLSEFIDKASYNHRLFVAIKIGNTRLIDNYVIEGYDTL